MRMFVGVLVVVVAVLLFVPTGDAAEMGKYIGLGVGQTKLDISSGDAGDPDQLDDSDTGLKLFGGLRVNENFAVEFGYINMGKATATWNNVPSAGKVKMEAKSSAIFAEAVGIVPIEKKFEVYGKLGLQFWSAKFDATSSAGPTASGDGTGTDLVYGLGFTYNITPNVAMRLEYENYAGIGDGVTVTASGGLGTLNMDGDDVSFMGLGVIYKF